MTQEVSPGGTGPVSLRGDSSLAGAAEEYGRQGFRVLPVHSAVNGVCSCREGFGCSAKGKHPRIGGWEKLATSDVATIAKWWAQWPDSNIGLAMGGEERLVALDIDGEAGRKSLAELESRYGRLPPTLTSRSGRLDGGEHRILRLSSQFDLARVNKVGFAPGLDTRANNAQIVAPPSIHVSGRVYTWVEEYEIAEMPKWLYECITSNRRTLRSLPPVRVDADISTEIDSFSLDDIRLALIEYRRKLATSTDGRDQEKRWIVGQILSNKPFAAPGESKDGAEANADLILGRDNALNQAMSILAWLLPDKVPTELALEIVKPSIMGMDCEPEGVDYWFFEAADMYARACARRDRKRAEEQEESDALVARFNRSREKIGLPPVKVREDTYVKPSASAPKGFLASALSKARSDVGGEEPDTEGTEAEAARAEATASGGDDDDAIDGGDDDGIDGGDDDADEEVAIVVAAGEVPRMVDEALAVLIRRDGNIYQRTGDLVFITREPEQLEAPYEKDRYVPGSVIMRPGTPKVRVVESPLLVEKLSRYATWVRQVKNKNGSTRWVELNPDSLTLQALVARRDWPGIRPLAGIIETPVLTPRGEILTRPGYDAETGFVYLPSVQIEPIPETLTQADAAESLRYLWTECFSDFPYRGLASVEAADTTREKLYEEARKCPDAFVVIALILTIMSRAAVKGAVPGFVFEAAAQGSGKSMQINIASLITTGRPASLATFPVGATGRANEEELEKLLASYALAGAQIIAFDNIKGHLGGPALEKVQTAPGSVALRVLGSTDLRVVPWKAVCAFSGNNMTMSDDVAQRNLLSRLESKLEDPRSRPASSFRHYPLLPWIEANRAKLVRACLIIMRAWALAENKPSCSMGSFEAWADVVPSMILYAGGPDVLETRPKGVSYEDISNDAHRTLMQNWPFPDPIKAADIVKRVFEGEQRDNPMAKAPKGYAEMREAIRALTSTQDGRVPNAASLGLAFRKLRGKIRGGLQILGKPNRDDVVEWAVFKVM